MSDPWGGRWGSRWGSRWGTGVPAPIVGRTYDATWTPPSYAALWEADAVIRTDFQVLKGEAPTFRFTATPPVDIAGRPIAMYVSRDADGRGQAAGVPLATATGSIVTAVSGVFDVGLTSTQTKTTLGAGRWRYDVWFTDDDTPIAGGVIRINVPARW